MLTERIMGKILLYDLILTELSPTDLPTLCALSAMGIMGATGSGIERTLLSLL